MYYATKQNTMSQNDSFNIDNDPQPVTPNPSKTGIGERMHASQPGEPESEPSGNAGGSDKSKRVMLIVIIVLAVLLIAGGVFLYLSSRQTARELAEAKLEKEQIELQHQEEMAQHDLDEIQQAFNEIESTRVEIITDSIKSRLAEKYEKARLEMEKLQRELRDSKNKSAKEIADLRGQISHLRDLLRQYLEEIDRLKKENAQLRTENEEVKAHNQQLNAQVVETTRQNEHLTERMTLAEKLNVTGVSFQALNGKGKNEKKVKKAKQLMITFTIPQNNSTPVGEKTIYARITTPEGQLLEGGGSFSFEGATLPASAAKTIDYGGQEIGGIKIYYDVRQAINAGAYTVELFADNYRLYSNTFNLK